MSVEQSNKKTQKKNPLSCTESGKRVDLTLNEQFTQSAFCGSCDQRFPVEARKTELVLPKHNISAELHEYRKKLEREQRA